MENTRQRTFIGILVVVIVVLASFLFSGVSSASPKKNAYQAVFLSNNQVYFGKLAIKGDVYVLNDVYYIQSNSAPGREKGTQENNTQLIKFGLGSEVHGPEDGLYIERSYVLFWENLRDDSKIVQAIKEFKVKSAAPTAVPAVVPVAPAQ